MSSPRAYFVWSIPFFASILATADAVAGPPVARLSLDSANPLLIENLDSGKLENTLYKVGMECAGFPGGSAVASTATVVLEVESPITVAINSARPFLVVAADRKYFCGPYGEGKFNLAAGKYDLFLSGIQVGKNVVANVSINDVKRPISYVSKVRTVELPSKIATPLSITGTLAANRTDDSRRYAREPDFILKASGLLADIKVQRISQGHLMRVMGPIADLKPTSTPGNVGHEWSKKLFEGSYYVWVGGDSQAPSEYTLMVTTSETTLDALHLATTPSNALSVSERRLDRHYPFLNGYEKGTYEADQLYYRLWTEAPAALFVFAKTDLQGSMIQAGPKDVQPPRAGEALLLTAFGACTADRLCFIVDDKLLSPTPVGPVKLPATARTNVERDNGFELTPPDSPKLAKFSAAKAKHDACVTKVYAKYNKSDASKYDLVTYKNGKVSKVENFGDKIENEAADKCKSDAFDTMQNALNDELLVDRGKRRTTELATLANRLSQLFPQ